MIIYKKRWQIELLFKQLEQDFPLKYFLGDKENTIEIQLWVAMLDNLLITLVKSKQKISWAFANMMNIIRQQLMNYANIYKIKERAGIPILSSPSFAANSFPTTPIFCLNFCFYNLFDLIGLQYAQPLPFDFSILKEDQCWNTPDPIFHGSFTVFIDIDF